MKRQTSGCIRQVRREEEAAVGRDGVLVAEQVLEHRRCRRPSGWIPCETWPSCCGSPSRTMLRAQVPSASASASETWPASSTNSVSTTPAMSSRAKSQAVPASSSTSSSGSRELRLVRRGRDERRPRRSRPSSARGT